MYKWFKGEQVRHCFLDLDFKGIDNLGDHASIDGLGGVTKAQFLSGRFTLRKDVLAHLMYGSSCYNQESMDPRFGDPVQLATGTTLEICLHEKVEKPKTAEESKDTEDDEDAEEYEDVEDVNEYEDAEDIDDAEDADQPDIHEQPEQQAAAAGPPAVPTANQLLTAFISSTSGGETSVTCMLRHLSYIFTGKQMAKPDLKMETTNAWIVTAMQLMFHREWTRGMVHTNAVKVYETKKGKQQDVAIPKDMQQDVAQQPALPYLLDGSFCPDAVNDIFSNLAREVCTILARTTLEVSSTWRLMRPSSWYPVHLTRRQ
ncbi:hypothetical protein BC831DRAFT_138980 [Entophlyctis helioformis]|nr:hypothetical protein BC831DRAFT_138980 [Entophlyctis helioformis]